MPVRLFVCLFLGALSTASHADGPLEPGEIASSEPAASPEILFRQQCLVMVHSGGGSYRAGSWDDALPGPCTDELKKKVIGYRRNGKPSKDAWRFHFVEIRSFSRQVSVSLTMRDGSQIVLGPVEEIRQERGSSPKRYPNAHIALDGVIQQAMKGANSYYWNVQSGVCFREALDIAPSHQGQLPQVTTKRIPLNFTDCVNPPTGITVVEKPVL